MGLLYRPIADMMLTTCQLQKKYRTSAGNRARSNQPALFPAQPAEGSTHFWGQRLVSQLLVTCHGHFRRAEHLVISCTGSNHDRNSNSNGSSDSSGKNKSGNRKKKNGISFTSSTSNSNRNMVALLTLNVGSYAS